MPGSIDYSKHGDDYHRLRHADIFGNARLIDGWSRYAAYRYFPDIEPNEDILEVGAGTGINVSYINRIANVSVVEPSAFAREHCRTLGLKSYGSLDDLSGRSFDRVLLRHVLEHVLDPCKMLIEVRKFLKSTGKLILVLPIESPYASVSVNDINHHLYCWNLQTITNLLHAVDFNVTEAEINYYNGKRILYPLLRGFGVDVYAKAMKTLGFVRRAGEYVIVATPNDYG